MGQVLESAFRKAMRSLTGAVCIVSTQYQGQRFGMTATAVTSVSADPPSLLVCINRAASLRDPVAKSGRFCVNILRADQMELAQKFGSRLSLEERFAHGTWHLSGDGVPYLAGAQASVLCDVEATYEYGTHSIVIGKVAEARVSEVVTPLIYQDGQYTVGLGQGIDWVISVGG